jgi:multimeric flavodoxin WrbA/putative sterol carrier protein
VLATPVYYYSFSALLKAFLERLLPTSLPFIDTASPTGMERNTPRDPARGPKRAVLIAVGAHRDPRLMDGLARTFEIICHGMSAEPAGVLRRPESFLLDFEEGKPLPSEKVRAAFAAAGRELAVEGRVRAETERGAATEFTRDLEMFQNHARVYWEIARRDGARGYDRRAVQGLAAADLRILAPELAASFDPVAAGDLAATIQFSIEGEAPGEFHLAIARGECAARHGAHPAPDATLTMGREAFMALVRQRVDARALVADGRIRVSGDRSLYLRLGRLLARNSAQRAE